jgi:UMF1 family MFS transporter
MRRSKQVWGWALYDWANSAFATTVMAGFFPVFFKSYWSAGTDVNTSTAQLGVGNSLASLAVAVMAPVLGAVADRGTARKKFLIAFAYLGVLATAALCVIGQGHWEMAILVYAVGILGFSGANVFYDSLLPEVAGKEEIDFVSGLGFAMGYLGGGVLFALNVFMVLKPHLFGLTPSTAVRFSFLTVAVWWGAFTLFTLFWVKETPHTPDAATTGNMFSAGFRQFAETFRKRRHLKTVFLFLLAYWLYIDGVDTIIRMAVDYGLSLGFESNDLILALLITQFVGFPSALLFGRLGERWDVRKAIFLAIGVYMFITVWGILMTEKSEFYVLAILIGTVQGGIQALSRSYYSRFIPRAQAGEFYGFYNMLGKFAAILGPALVGLVGILAKGRLMPAAPTPEQVAVVEQAASRWSIGSLLILFLVGGTLLYFVDEEKGRRELEGFEEGAGQPATSMDIAE